MEKDKFLTRMKRLEGQVKAVIRMYNEKRDCEEMIQQLRAARAAFDKAIVHLLKEEICKRVSREKKEKTEKLVEQLLKVN